MRNETGKISVQAALLMAVLLFIMSGWIAAQAKQFLFKQGYFHPTIQEVEALVRKDYKTDIVTCYKTTTGDWDFICDHTHFPPFAPDKPERFKWGVRAFVEGVGSLEGLITTDPTPTTREENRRRLREHKRKI